MPQNQGLWKKKSHFQSQGMWRLVFCWKPAHMDYTDILENVLTAVLVGVPAPWLCGVTTAFFGVYCAKVGKSP